MLKMFSKKHLIREIESKLDNSSLSFTITGVMLFGSIAKGSGAIDSDIDVLIIANNINPKRQKRDYEIAEIKHIISGRPLDIVLITSEEAESNFKNHNPLFLDIAEDGIIIFEREHFLSDLIEETKEYIKTGGIKRIDNGWEFPVKRGVPTYLSEVSNKDFSIAMIRDGERDFIITQNLLNDNFYDKSVYHFQQAVEKFIKSILIAIGIFQKTHFVGGILRESVKDKPIEEEWKNKLSDAAEISETIEPAVSLSRYPGIIGNRLWLPYDEYERSDAENAMKKAEDVMATAKSFFEYWFQ